MEKHSRVYIAGHTGLIGSAIFRILKREGYNIFGVVHSDCELTLKPDVDHLFKSYNPEYVFICAAKVGGIGANISSPADFIESNLMVQSNIMNAACKYGTKKLLFLGSSCIYPKDCQQPIKEEYIMSGPLEPTNDAYAIAKIAGIKTAQAYRKQYGCNFISVMPTNLYGPHDNYNLETCHVLPALIRRFHEAKIAEDKYVTLWGTGSPRREFLYSGDCAEACVMLMDKYDSGEIINIGYGCDYSILEISTVISEIVGFQGQIKFDPSKPDGMKRKLLDSSKINKLGWKPKTPIVDGIKKTYDSFLAGECRL